MADERVRTAMRNWGPRFVVRGVDYGDVLRLTDAIEAWEDWLPRWQELAMEWEALAGEWESVGRTASAGSAWQRAALGFHFARFLSVEDEQAYLAASERAVAAHRHVLRPPDFPPDPLHPAPAPAPIAPRRPPP